MRDIVPLRFWHFFRPEPKCYFNKLAGRQIDCRPEAFVPAAVVQPFVERACLSASDNSAQVLTRNLDPEFNPAALFQSRECRLALKARCISFMCRFRSVVVT